MWAHVINWNCNTYYQNLSLSWVLVYTNFNLMSRVDPNSQDIWFTVQFKLPASKYSTQSYTCHRQELFHFYFWLGYLITKVQSLHLMNHAIHILASTYCQQQHFFGRLSALIYSCFYFKQKLEIKRFLYSSYRFKKIL